MSRIRLVVEGRRVKVVGYSGPWIIVEKLPFGLVKVQPVENPKRMITVDRRRLRKWYDHGK